MTETQINDEDRRAYWIAQMEEAHDFMLKMREYPVAECGEPMVSLTEAVDAAIVEVEFSTKAHVRGFPRLYFLRQTLIDGFIAAARDMNERGWLLKVEDGYRTVEMQRHLGRQEYTFNAILRKVMWECGGVRPPADLVLRRLSVLVANSPKVGTHMSGSAIDISVLNRDNHREVDRGGPYLDMSERTPMDSLCVPPEARNNRTAITALMRRHGFVTYPYEFWHYNAGDAYGEFLNGTGQPARYGPVHLDLADGSVTPMEDPRILLNSQEDIQELIEGALQTMSESSA